MPVTVFISYSWDSDEFKQSVVDLAMWLQTAGQERLNIEIDYKYSITPPEEGWQSWMVKTITESDVVLVVCTANYAAKFSKREKIPTSGKGVRLEGAIITQEIYNNFQQNKKFFPIVPDGD